MQKKGIRRWLQKKFLEKALDPVIPVISIKAARDKQKDFIFLDTRESDEYAVSHIAGAIFTGFNNFNETNLSFLKQNDPIIVYCSIGIRSEKIARKLLSQGFTNVQNLYGGIFEWFNEAYEVFNNDGLPTLNIHPYNKKFSAWINKGNKIYGLVP